MFINVLCSFYFYLVIISVINVYCYNDFSNEMPSTEMLEDGKNQYQLIQERGNLPQYGDCWKSAVEHIHEGCRYLTEDVQSDLALRLTNCFLEMSGHETYNCDFDRKQNVRRICISSMTDRAFNVYTEFYTHAQNICWFLRGQIWQEKISERTQHVGEQLKESLNQQDTLLKQQKESLTMQLQLLNYGRNLENILGEVKNSTLKHQKLMNLMTGSLTGLQSWLIGEISWFDTLVFYLISSIVIIFITSTQRTASARLPLFLVLTMNALIERFICNNFQSETTSHINTIQASLYQYTWWCRKFTILISTTIVLIQSYFYRDYLTHNNFLLLKIHEQNTGLKLELEQLKTKLRRSVENEMVKPYNSDTPSDFSTVSPDYNKYNRFVHARASVSIQKDQLDNVSTTSSVCRYNLRSRQGTPLLNY